MSEGAFTAAQLRGLIGQRVRHRGLVCVVIEVLEDGPALVLEDCRNRPAIQDDQYGEPHRLAPRSFVLPVWKGRELNPDFLNLELADLA
jgi:hypothetical protein